MSTLKTTGLRDIKMRNSAKEHITTSNIVEWVVGKVQELPEIESLKFNMELTLYIGSCIEIACLENSIKTDKLVVFTQIYKRLFDISVQDEVVICQMLNFLHSNNLIKGLKYPIKNFLKKSLKLIIPFIF